MSVQNKWQGLRNWKCLSDKGEGEEDSDGDDRGQRCHEGTQWHLKKAPLWASLVAQTVRNLPAMQETQVWAQGQEDPLEKGMAIHSSILAWEILWTEEPGGLHSPWGRKESDTV